MDKMIVTVFDSEKQAYEGSQALQQLESEGSIGLYAVAVISKDSEGKVELKQAADQGPLGTAVGMLTGSLIGLLGGPVGMAVGSITGASLGSIDDLNHAGVDAQFLAEVSEELLPGSSAVVAEVAEGWTTPLTTRMENIGGVVLRRRRTEVVDDQIRGEIAAQKAELAELQAEFDQAVGDAKERLKASVESVETKLTAAVNKANDFARQLENEATAKVAALEAQIAKAGADVKTKFETRIQEIRDDYASRAAKLKKAGTLTAEAIEA